jgi:FkbM family methyltransferase
MVLHNHAEIPNPDMQRHEVFSRFRQFSGEVPSGFHLDFLGTQVSHEFVAGLDGTGPCPAARTVQNHAYPPFDEEYFEWVDLLESVVAAKGSYTMIELGAGFGRWAVRAAFAARQFNPKLRCHVIAVEAEPTVYSWMKKHFRHNGLKPRWHTLIHAAVTTEPGEVEFCIGGPRGGPFDRPPNAWYGQFLAKGNKAFGESRADGRYCGFKVLLHTSGWRSIRIPGVTLQAILKKLDRVDLIDLDVEGQELASLTSVADELDAKVKRLHIGTHGQEIEAGLRQLLSAHGWQCHADYSLFSTSETPWGPVHFENGVQTWVNPKVPAPSS